MLGSEPLFIPLSPLTSIRAVCIPKQDFRTQANPTVTSCIPEPRAPHK